MMDIKQQQFNRPLIIAGPCSAESQEQLLTTAKGLEHKATIFRAGVWKPRTRPNSFEGVGQDALEWLKVVKNETNLKVATEVANTQHVEQCLKAGIDVLWLGARTTVNPFYVQEIAESLRGVDIQVMVKNPLHPELSLWMGAIERLNQVGVTQLSAVHRGFFTLEKSAFRNEPKWEIPIKLKRLMPDLPIICDPSHISGSPHMLAEVSQTAMDLNMDGLMIETHYNPSIALSDAQQQITPQELIVLLDNLILRTSTNTNTEFKTLLNKLRLEIDDIDKKLIDIVGQRTNIVREIGRYKKENAVTILQIERWFDILKSRKEWGEDSNLDPQMVAELFELIHKHSVLTQTHILNK
ncbi:bifunctional 3-deoxy-7-phosphoheptulonate synthase/chorismate mutase type II [Flavobacteriales bacterium]|jgi:chorismate mutase|nr:bifunctional 3-deoxy-7-phosphoheptulonate synthase/chorismate mutase type II [Flavobacteriales bacterium]